MQMYENASYHKNEPHFFLPSGLQDYAFTRVVCCRVYTGRLLICRMVEGVLLRTNGERRV